MIKIVLFDVNNTLFNDFRVWFKAIEETFRVFGKQPLTVREYFEGLKGEIILIYTENVVLPLQERK